MIRIESVSPQSTSRVPALHNKPQSLNSLAGALILASGLIVGTPAYAAPPAGMQIVTSIEGVTEYRLANGLRVLLMPDTSKPQVTANLVYLVGSKHEGPGESGMAHLLEHLLFKGTPTTADPKAEFVKRGMRWNGTTYLDRTNYFATFNAEADNLDWYLGWLADSMVNSFIARRDLDSEMTVVRNEFERGEADFGRVLSQRMAASAYQWHPYGKATIGSLADIENVSIDSLQRFYRQFYQPDNAVLVVAGKFEVDPTLARIDAAFASLPRPARVLAPVYSQEPVQEGERAVTLRRVGGVPLISAMYHTVAGGGREAVTQAVLQFVLGSEPNGRLNKALVETGLAASKFAYTRETQDPGSMVFGIVLADQADAGRAELALLDTLESMPPVTEEEVSRARTAILNVMNRQLLDANQFAIGLTDEIAIGDWRLAFAKRDWLQDVTAADVNRLARAYLIASNRTLGRYFPTEAPVRAPATARADSEKLLAGYQGRQAQAAVDTFELNNLEIEARTVKTTLPGGMKIATLARPVKGDRILGTLRLHWGSLDALQGKRTDALLLGALMKKGTLDLSRQALQDRLNELDATVNVHAGLTGANVDFSTPKANLAQTVELLRDILRKPAFPETEFEQARRALITGNQADLSNVNALASNALNRHLLRYPDDDPRAVWTPAQNQEAARSATLERTRAFYEAWAGARHSELALVGPVDPVQVADLFGKAFDDWQGNASYVRIPNPLQDIAAQRIVIHTPDQANAVYLARQPIDIEEDSADLPALNVAVQLLGGRRDSRLWQRLREKDGLSYGVSSSLSTSLRDRSGALFINGTYAPQNRDRFEAGVREELARALKDGFSAAEVASAKDTILTLRKQTLAEERTVASVLASNLYWKRTLLMREERDRKYAAVTADEVNAALRKYIDPGKLSVAVAGDFEKK